LVFGEALAKAQVENPVTEPKRSQKPKRPLSYPSPHLSQPRGYSFFENALAHDASAFVQEDALVVQPPPLGGQETILVVEDNDEVRAYTTDILRELGYEVFEATEGDTALSLIASEPRIKLLFTDVGLPGPLNGRQIADEARKLSSDLKVLFTTGYAQNAIIHQGRLDPGVQLIVKPFNFAGLAAKIRQMFDEAE